MAPLVAALPAAASAIGGAAASAGGAIMSGLSTAGGFLASHAGSLLTGLKTIGTGALNIGSKIGGTALQIGKSVAANPITKSVLSTTKSIASNPATNLAMGGASLFSASSNAKASLQASQDAMAAAAAEESAANASALKINTNSRKQLNSYGASLSGSSTALNSSRSNGSSYSLLSTNLN